MEETFKPGEIVTFKNEKNPIYKVLSLCKYGEVNICLLNLNKPMRTIEGKEYENTLYTNTKALTKIVDFKPKQRYEQLSLF